MQSKGIVADGQLSTAQTAIYSVPMGQRFTPRWLSAYNTGAATETTEWWIKSRTGAARKFAQLVLAPNYSGRLFDRNEDLLLSEGDQILAKTSTTAGVVDFVLAGETAP